MKTVKGAVSKELVEMRKNFKVLSDQNAALMAALGVVTAEKPAEKPAEKQASSIYAVTPADFLFEGNKAVGVSTELPSVLKLAGFMLSKRAFFMRRILVSSGYKFDAKTKVWSKITINFSI